MPPISSFDTAREALDQTIGELREQLKQAEEARAALGGGKPARRGPGRPPGRPRGSTNKTATAGAPRRRRKRRGGTRADQAVKLIEGQPGISASDVASSMKIKPNYLYRVLGDLEKEGRVKKDGRKYYPSGG
jgi:CRP-like cAMP-binding protein